MAGPSVTKQVALFVNGKTYSLEIESRTTLAEALRERLDLTGTKVGCNRAECGTCTVLVDGRAVYSCTMLAVHAAGKNIQTIEGVAQAGKLDPLQQALMDEDGLQCGFCTPGMIMSLKALLNRKTDVSRRDVREAIAGNYCRCGAYPNIVEAVLKLGRNSSGAG
ncbi:MAG: (2Fe-2S)-binding protein [Betaproteobacteria bacterium]|nr:MAG: (2Fe-2S)-binding protein [Betaproteobacteria bacterium]